MKPGIAKACIAALLAAWLVGCTATARCPQEFDEPRPAFLLGHGRHTTLVLSDGKGSLWRYGYGDWRYYAEADTGFWPGVQALLWPTPSALGRQKYQVAYPTRATVLKAVRAGIGELQEFQVSGTATDSLLWQLDRTFERGARQDRLVNDPYDFVFVPYPQRYWFGHNSTHKVAAWLEDLGCDVRGNALISVEIVTP